MIRLHLPAPLRPLAGGEAEVLVSGETLGEAIEALDRLYPGLKARLATGERVRSGWAVFANGASASPLFSSRLPDDAEIHFVPAISGGCVHSLR
jgi:molybdopterin converting factor small subunit